jgi:biopolymer transport protein TolQ
MNLILPFPLLANGLEFGWRQSSTEGIVICVILALMSVGSWTAMIAKVVLLRRARRANAEFVSVFRSSPHPLSMYQNGEHFDFAPYYHIYHEAARELAFHLVGSDQPDRTFAARLQGAGRISPSQMSAVQIALERAVGEAALKFEHGLSTVSIALSGAPFIGLLGTVWGIMGSFAALATSQQGESSIQAMAPGVCAALLTTVVGLLVAIPSMFGYNVLITRIREMVVRMDNFASELSSTFDRRYVDHQTRPNDELPSVGSLGSPKVVSFSPPVASATANTPRHMPPPSRQPASAVGG